MVTNNCRDFDIQAAVIGFHQQIAKAMRFFSDQNHYPAPTGRIQLTHGAFWQCAIEIRQQGGIIKNPFQFRAHKKAPGTVINKFIVLYDI